MADKVLAWLGEAIKTPPLSTDARIECGVLLRRLQRGESLAMPHSRPMPAVGPRCHELRVTDENRTWRIMYRIDPDAIVVVAVFEKRTQKTPSDVIVLSKRRLKAYDDTTKG